MATRSLSQSRSLGAGGQLLAREFLPLPHLALSIARHRSDRLNAPFEHLARLLRVAQLVQGPAVVEKCLGIVRPVFDEACKSVARLRKHRSGKVSQSNFAPGLVMAVLFVLFNHYRK